MQKRRSAGVIIFRNTPQGRQYLLLHYKKGHWDFPKGAIERDEDIQQAARRELLEETGLDKIEVLEGFCEKIEYDFTENDQLVHKEVIYFLGRTRQKNITLSDEHLDSAWLPYQKALERLTYEQSKQLLKQVEAFQVSL